MIKNDENFQASLEETCFVVHCFFVKPCSHIFFTPNPCYCSLIPPIKTEKVEGKISAQRWFLHIKLSFKLTLSLLLALPQLSHSLESAMLIKLLQPSGGGARGRQKNEILIFIRSICLRSSSQSWKEQSAERRWNSRLLQRWLIKLHDSRNPSTMHFVYSIIL